MVGDHNQTVSSPNATYFAVQHWYDMRESYTNIQSNEYDDLKPFLPAWEFTQMVWKSNSEIGCAYVRDVLCEDMYGVGESNMYQLYCLLTPGGNKWDQWQVKNTLVAGCELTLLRGANVECRDCTGVEPQTATVNTTTITHLDQTIATPSPLLRVNPSHVKVSLSSAMDRVEQYLSMNEDEFLARWNVF